MNIAGRPASLPFLATGNFVELQARRFMQRLRKVVRFLTRFRTTGLEIPDRENAAAKAAQSDMNKITGSLRRPRGKPINPNAGEVVQGARGRPEATPKDGELAQDRAPFRVDVNTLVQLDGQCRESKNGGNHNGAGALSMSVESGYDACDQANNRDAIPDVPGQSMPLVNLWSERHSLKCWRVE